MTKSHASDGWVYLDNNATTRMDGRVVEAMLPFFREHFANPSSMHGLSSEPAEAIRVARRQVMSLLGADRESEIIFTSGGTESNNAAIFSALEMRQGRSEIIISAVEHPSVLVACARLERIGRARVHRIPVDRNGILDLDAYRLALSEQTALVSVQWANYETGVIYPIELLASMAHETGALFHSDAVQAAGKLAIDLKNTEIDMLSVSAHKIHGPKGIGALYLRYGVDFAPLVHGGRQERGRRAGTENTAAIVGFGVAAELAGLSMSHDMARIGLLRDSLEREILGLVPSAISVALGAPRLPNTANLAFADVEADSLLLMLDRALIAASSGSGCTSGSMNPSHVLCAMKVPFSHLRGSIRLSFSRENTDRDVERVLEVLPQAVKELQTHSAAMEVAFD
jgi:cysteine desulfurase